MLMEKLDYNLLCRWFVGLNMDDPIWDVSLFTKNRQRLLDGEIAEAFFEAVLAQARGRQLLSAEDFTVDGTLIQAWAGLKSFRRRDERGVPPPDDPGNPTVNHRLQLGSHSEPDLDPGMKMPPRQSSASRPAQTPWNSSANPPRFGLSRTASQLHRRGFSIAC